MITSAQSTFLALAATASLKSEHTTGVPASVTLSQAIFESGWGVHAPYNNYFGIKANGRGSGCFVTPTQECVKGKYATQDLAFEKYASMEACFVDHAFLFTHLPIYSTPWKAFQVDRNVDKFVLSIGPIYASAKDYGQTILAFSKSSLIQNALH